MKLAGQNKYWGKIEEATEFWKDVGVDHLMVKPHKDIEIVGEDGEIKERDFERLEELQERYGVSYHPHIYNMVLGGEVVTPSSPEMGDLYRKILEEVDGKIQEYNLYPLIDVHVSWIHNVDHDFEVPEGKALERARDLFGDLQLKSKLALETLHDPQEDYALLGYEAEHFSEIIEGNGGLGICIDTGHTNMTSESLNEILKLSCPIYSMHLNGNEGADRHELPRESNLNEYLEVIEAVRDTEEIVTFEIRNHNYSKSEVEKSVDFWKEKAKSYI